MYPALDPFYQVRQWVSVSYEVLHEGGPFPGEPLVKAAVGVVIKNPFAGQWVEDLSALTNPSASLGITLGARAVALLGGRPVEGYGKGKEDGRPNNQVQTSDVTIPTLYRPPLSQNRPPATAQSNLDANCSAH